MPVKNRNKVEKTKESYSKYARIAYKTAYSITKGREDSEDIAQLVAMRLYLNQEKINPDSTHNWVIATSKNESYLMAGKKSKEIHKTLETYDEYEQKITDSLLENRSNLKSIELLLKKIENRVSEKERTILEKYFFEGKKISDQYTKRFTNIKKKTLYQNIYRLRKEVRAEYFRETGMKSSKNIVSFNLNQNIMRFIKRYKQCLDNKSFTSMSKYFKEIGIPDKIPNLKIKEIIDYDIQLTGRNEYEIFVYFINHRGCFEVFSTEFSFSGRNTLIVKTIPNNQEMSHWCIIDDQYAPQEIKQKLEETDREGYSILSYIDDIDATVKTMDRSSYSIKKITHPRKMVIDHS